MKRTRIVLVLALAVTLPAAAQESASYRLTEHTLNNGGHPAQGLVPVSASFRISLHSLGDLGRAAQSSGSYQVDGGFGVSYPPPAEVNGLLFLDDETLVWDVEKSVGVYHLYRDLLGNLAGLGYGTCQGPDLVGETATDPDLPPGGDGFFYLATAENLLSEEGTKGFHTNAAERGNPVPCP